MKTNFLYILIVSILIIGCEGSTSRFYEPQPAKVKSLKKFPKEFQSKHITPDNVVMVYFDHDYELEKDSVIHFDITDIIEITENKIYNNINGFISFDLSSINDSVIKEEVRNDFSIINKEIEKNFNHVNYQLKLISSKDSIFIFKLSLQDTTFCISNKNVIKRYKDKIYLSIETSEHNWKVIQFYLDEDANLNIKTISKDDEVLLKRILTMNDEITEEKSYDPSKESFKMFLRMDGFNTTKFKLKKIDADNSP